VALPTNPLKGIGAVWDLARKVHNLLDAQDKASKAIAALDDEVQALKVEIERLKVREEVVIARAQAAASVAASGAAMQSMVDTARRIGSLEAQLSMGRSLPPPEPQDRG
jgi:ABC-type Fe3+-hydroxamate transport system substrate-binding protein